MLSSLYSLYVLVSTYFNTNTRVIAQATRQANFFTHIDIAGNMDNA